MFYSIWRKFQARGCNLLDTIIYWLNRNVLHIVSHWQKEKKGKLVGGLKNLGTEDSWAWEKLDISRIARRWEVLVEIVKISWSYLGKNWRRPSLLLPVWCTVLYHLSCQKFPNVSYMTLFVSRSVAQVWELSKGKKKLALGIHSSATWPRMCLFLWLLVITFCSGALELLLQLCSN